MIEGDNLILVFKLIFLLGFSFVTVIIIGLHLAWGMLKFICGLGLFFIFPWVFVLAALSGGFALLLWPVTMAAVVFCSIVFNKL